ncbi:MAG: DUF192 domain-containing protein [bacterium]
MLSKIDFIAICLLILISFTSLPAFSAEIYDTTVLDIHNPGGETVAKVEAKVADKIILRYLGLSNTEKLATGEGMWFVYPEADTRTFVMRKMNYPLDIIFVGEDKKITKIYQAPVEDTKPLTPYSGWARWVLEVPYGWSADKKVEEGFLIEPRKLKRGSEK